MILTTKLKVALASLAYKAIAIGRSALGKDDCANVGRGGARWSLDLREGIDFSIYLLGAFEKSTGITLQKLVKPGDVVFDIGANIGAHTLGLAQSVGAAGKVIAFEPADFAFEKLKSNLALNPELQARTSAYQVLLAASPAATLEPEIYASWPLKTAEAVHPKHRGRLVTTANAKIDTLDNFVHRQAIGRLNLIKIDVDGHEFSVLQGGLKTLKKFHPVLVMEMSPYVHAEYNAKFADFVALLRDMGYSLRDVDTWKSLPLDAEALEALIPDGASINVIAEVKDTSATVRKQTASFLCFTG